MTGRESSSRAGSRGGACASALAVLLAAGLLGCREPLPEVAPARVVDPPAGYAGDLARDRTAKDERFRTSPDSPLPDSMKASFRGLEYYPPDPAYRLAGKLSLYPSAERVPIVGTRGERRVAERWAVFDFILQGRTRRLQVYRLFEPGDPEGSVFLPFSDETTGRETYPAGRYIDPEIGADNTIVVDFNTAYYPYCAYGKDYDCPITPAENRLDLAIRAGEKGRSGRALAPLRTADNAGN